MKGLLYKDISIMTRSFKGNILLLVALYGVLILVTREAYLAYAMTVVWGIYVASTINYDEQAHWDAYAATLPVTPGQVIGSKYLLCAASTAIGAVLSRALVFLAGVGGAEYTLGILVCAEVSVLMNALLMPITLPFWCGQVARVFNGHCVCYRFRGVFCRTGDSTKPDAGGHCRHEYHIASQNRPYSGHNCPVALVDCCALCHQLHHLCARLREKGEMKNLRSAFTQGAGFVYRSIVGEDARIDPYKMRGTIL